MVNKGRWSECCERVKSFVDRFLAKPCLDHFNVLTIISPPIYRSHALNICLALYPAITSIGR